MEISNTLEGGWEWGNFSHGVGQPLRFLGIPKQGWTLGDVYPSLNEQGSLIFSVRQSNGVGFLGDGRRSELSTAVETRRKGDKSKWVGDIFNTRKVLRKLRVFG